MSTLVLKLWRPPGLRLINGDLVDCLGFCVECDGDGKVYDWDEVKQEVVVKDCPHCDGEGWYVQSIDFAHFIADVQQEMQIRFRVEDRLRARYGTIQPTDVRDYWEKP
jgi:RecJ-like exonuclease